LYSKTETYGSQDIAIVIGMGFAFFVLLLVLTEINSDISERRAVVSFMRGGKAPVVANSEDEEKGEITENESDSILPNVSFQAKHVDNSKPPPMTDIFSWQHLTYTITVSGGERRRLLNDVSGYVAPGKLTALMGESGAGKVWFALSSQRYFLTDDLLNRQRC
jgi:ATP-binding cassette subfamily G (WHITE) protein 2 (SNQ2)